MFFDFLYDKIFLNAFIEYFFDKFNLCFEIREIYAFDIIFLNGKYYKLIVTYLFK